MTEQVKHYETKPILTKAEFIEKYKAIIDIPDDKLKDSKMNYSTIQKTFPQITSEEVKTIALLRMEKHRKEIIDWSREQVAFLKEVVKANVPVDAIAKTLAPASISSPAPFEKLPTEAKGIDLSINIPEKAKKFGVTPNMVELLTKYGITATFIPAWRDGGSASNDRINMKKK